MLLLVAPVIISCQSQPDELSDNLGYDPEVYGDLERISPRDQVVVLWHPYQREREQVLLALVDEFNTSNAWGVTVIGEYGGSSADLQAELVSRIESRTKSRGLPQVVVADPHQAASYAARGGLVALDPYVESERWGYTGEALDDFLPVALSTDSLPQFDERYGWPLYASTPVMYYNEDWLIELGYTEAPVTWDQFGEMACAASDAEAGTFGYEVVADATTFAAMLASRGGRVIDREGSAYAFGGDAGTDSLAFVQDLLDRGCATVKTEWLGDRRDFAEGRVLFVLDSTTRLPAYRRAVAEGAGFAWSVAPLPTSQETPQMVVRGPRLSMFRATPEKQLAAWLFFQWLSEPEQQVRWSRAFSLLPVRISTTGLLESYYEENPRYREALGLLEYETVTEPGVTGYAECQDAIEVMVQAVRDGSDLSMWLADTVQACDASLAER